MSRKSPPLALVVLLSCSALGFLLAIQLRARRAEAQTPDTVVEQPGPLAIVKTIVVGEDERDEAFTPNEVTIVHDRNPSGAKTGTMLYLGDQVITGKDTRLTILFLDGAAEKDNEVLVYSNSRVQLGSIFTWAGKILARVKDSFSAKTTRAQWSVTGTEYELAVDAKAGTNKLVVLKGEVKVETGKFAPTLAENSIEEATPPDDGAMSMFLPASYREPEPLPQQTPMEFVAVAGRVIKIDREFILTNSCRQQHRYQIASPLNLNWFQFLGGEQFQIAGGQTRKINFAIQLDGTNLPVGVQQSQIVFPCLDCDTEPGCSIGGLFLPITVNIIPPKRRALSSPSPSPAASPQRTPAGLESATVGRMQELTLVRTGPLRQSEASEAEVDEALNWSNEVIIPGAPSYPAQSVVPRYATAEERSRAFRERRRSSVINDDQQSKEALADVYVDWGNGPKAEEELKRSGLRAPQTPQQMITLGEAYRLEGKLVAAGKVIARAIELDPNSPAAFNALGNVFLDMARADEDRGNTEQARRYLARAENQYLKAQAVKPPLQNHSQAAATTDRARKAAVVAQSNIGEVHLRLGELARGAGRSDEALNQFQVASQSFSKATKIDPTYAFALTGIGDAYRDTGETLLSRGDQSAADSHFQTAKDLYFRATKLHGDMAEAYVGVGKVFDDTGNPDEARRYYVKATQVRPELPDPHYRLAVALAVVDPGRAAEQAGAFLKIVREPLKQGRQANDARGIEQGVPPTSTPTPRPTRTGTTPTPSPTPTPTPISTSGPLVPMPHMLGDSPEKGLRKLSDVGLIGEIQEQADCKVDGKIVGTNPGRDARVSKGSRVIVYISGAGPNAVAVPNVRRKLLADAENELRSSRLQSKVYLRTQDDSVPENTVLDQRPASGKLLPPDCTVQLTIAIPVPPVRVPSYVGLTKQQAYQQLSGDLRRGRVSDVENCKQLGIVVSQNPAEGKMVPRGSTVDLVIGKCTDVEPPPPQYVNVPNVVGQSFKQAAAILKNAGLVAEYSVGDTSAKVVTQEPAQGKVLKGTHVKLFPAKIL